MNRGFQRPGGSSPHTRGLLRGSKGLEFMQRIIPAHAGFTPWRRVR